MKYMLRDDSDWIESHFFVSEPGYFAGYLLGMFFAKDLYNYINLVYGTVLSSDAGKFLIDNIWRPANQLRYLELLETIHFFNVT